MTQTQTIGKRAALGVAWVTGQSLATRVISFFAQMSLAWFLSRGDFALFGVATTIAAFSGILNQGGITKVLVHRQNSIDKWAAPGFWLSLIFGLLISVAMIVIGYISSRNLTNVDGPKLFQLVCILAIVPPLQALKTVPVAILQSKMMFREITMIGTAFILLTAIVKVALAALGFGAFSFVLPAAIVAPLIAVTYWRVAKPEIPSNPRFRKWRFMLSDSSMIILTAFWYKLITHGDYVILAAMVTQDDLGLYFFAFNYAVQAIILFTQGVASVSFPALATLRKDTDRQFRAFCSATRTLAVIVFPVCALQAALAEPIITNYFPAKWHGSIPMLQMLSIGMAGRTISWICASLMESQGRFRARMWLGCVLAILFLMMVYFGALQNGAIGVAVAVAAYYPLMSIITAFVALSAFEEGMASMLRVCIPPILLSAISVGGAYVLVMNATNHGLTQIVVICCLSAAIYLTMLRFLMRNVWFELTGRFNQLLGLGV